MLMWQTFMINSSGESFHISKNPVQAVAKMLGLGYVQVQETLRRIRDVKHFLYFSGIHCDAPTQSINPSSSVSQHRTDGEECPDQSKHSKSDKPTTKKRTLEEKRASSWATKAERALEEGISLRWGGDTQLWHALSQMFPRSTTKRVEELYIQEHHVQALVGKYGGTFMQMQLRLQLIRSLKVYLRIAGVHEEMQPFEVETTRDAVSVVLEGVVDVVVEAYTVRCVVHDVMLCLLDAVCTDAANLLPSVPDTEHTCPPSPRPHNTKITTATTTATASTSTLPLSHQYLPFVFTLKNEGEIWRAYCESQLPQQTVSHQSTLAAKLTLLAQTLGCTFTQIRNHLTLLINLHLGLSAQQHSAGRAFTISEEERICQALAETDSSSFPAALTSVAKRVGCSVGAVAGCYRQLKTLRLLNEVRSEVQSPLIHTSTTNTSTIVQHPVVVVTRTTKVSSRATTARSRVSQKKMQPPVEMERDIGAEMGYFSTEGESESEEA